jgi:hypothetical protein
MQGYSGGLHSLGLQDNFIDDNTFKTSGSEKTSNKIGQPQGNPSPYHDTPSSPMKFGIELENEMEGMKELQSMAIIRYKDWRDATLDNTAWAELDASINGPDWSPANRVWINLPIVRHQYDKDILLGFSNCVQQYRCEAEANLMLKLRHDVHQLHQGGWATPPANIIQGKFMRMVEFLCQIYPGMIKVVNQSDLP